MVSADEAVARVQDGQRVYLHGGAATPIALVEALVRRAQGLVGVEIVHLHTEAPAPYVAPTLRGHIRHNALFIGPNVRKAVQSGAADYTPVFLSEIPDLFRPGGPLELDFAFVQVAPPDGDGNYSLGVSVDCAVAAVEHARMVVAQVNHRMPRTVGSTVPADAITLVVEEDCELPEAGLAPITPESVAIGKTVAALIPDGATLQLGIGAVPNAVLNHLGGHRDLGIHTEMFSDGMIPLIQAGVVTAASRHATPASPSPLSSSAAAVFTILCMRIQACSFSPRTTPTTSM